MTLLIWIALTLLLPVAASADRLAPVEPGSLACTKPQALEQVCSCLMKARGDAERCKLLGGEEVKGARLVRVDASHDGAVYLVAKGPGGWRAVREIQWEQHKSKRESNMHPDAQSEITIGTARVYRLDYRYEEEEADTPEIDTKQSLSLFCLLEGTSGAPACTVEVTRRCDVAVTDENNEATHTTGETDVVVGQDGRVTVTRKKPVSGKTCLRGLGAHRLW